MITIIKKLSYTTSITLGIIFYLLTILIHILILINIIPLEWINGGRSLSLQTQLPLSIFNLLISLLGIIFLIYAFFNIGKKTTIFISRIFTALWLFGFLQQLLGTPFEKLVISIILLLGLISHFRVGLEK